MRQKHRKLAKFAVIIIWGTNTISANYENVLNAKELLEGEQSGRGVERGDDAALRMRSLIR